MEVAIKEQEDQLLGQFVAVLNAKKEEITRLRASLEEAKRRLHRYKAKLTTGGAAAGASSRLRLDKLFPHRRGPGLWWGGDETRGGGYLAVALLCFSALGFGRLP